MNKKQCFYYVVWRTGFDKLEYLSGVLFGVVRRVFEISTMAISHNGDLQ